MEYQSIYLGETPKVAQCWHKLIAEPPMRDILDLDQFPLDRPHSPGWVELVHQCRVELAENGMFNLFGFFRPEVAKQEAKLLEPRFETEGFLHERDHNIYFLKSVAGVDPDHPALQRFRTSNRTLCADQFPQSAVIRLYEWTEFAQFLAATMEMEALHTMADSLARVNIMAYREGQTLNWHFDRSEFTTTLLLQAPEEGGDFEYRTGLRSADDPNYDGVANMLNGRDDAVRQLKLSAGTLNVFKGKNTAHRVTPIQGNRPRIISVFSFYETPGIQFSDDERIGFYGRAS